MTDVETASEYRGRVYEGDDVPHVQRKPCRKEAMTEREAQRRVDEACELIRSAYRLAYLRPTETVNAVRSAIAHGMEQAAEDAREEANAA